ncbi:EthD family reductase [Phytohalomonas tamaricis]|uniref:EthD family reductase n=1 Tax=Phytohalomonas tamaricis TaxID=2081032 RepID=UPI001319FD6C|nr:EthD family reductase [Phytohalomonas tamaricis]
MIIVSVMYPYQENSHFDMEYYQHSHRSLVKERLGDALKGFSIEQGISSSESDEKPRYVAIARLLFDSHDAFAAAMGPHQEEFTQDVANFTNLTPSMQISELVVSLDDQNYR